MSFMSGLAESFGQQISQGEAQRATTREDIFKMAYDNYINRQASYNDDQRKDQIMVDEAKSAASAAGAPDGAWQYAHEWLIGGTSYEDVIKRLQATTFASTATPAMPDTPVAGSQAANPSAALGTDTTNSALMPSPSAATSSSPQAVPASSIAPPPVSSQVAQQTQASGLGALDSTQMPVDNSTPQAASSAISAPQPTDLMGNAPYDPMTADTSGPQVAPAPTPQGPMNAGQSPNDGQLAQPMTMSNLFDPKQIQARQMDKVNQQIEGATGVTPQQMQKINYGYVPQGVNESAPGITYSGSPTQATYNPLNSMMAYNNKSGQWENVNVLPGGVFRNSNGQLTQASDYKQPITPDMYGKLLTNVGQLTTVSQPAATAKANAISTVNVLGQMVQLAQKDPVVLTKSDQLSEWYNTAKNELNGFAAQLSAGQSVQQIAQGILNKAPVSKGIGSTASDSQRFAQLEDLAASYMALQEQGVDPRNLSAESFRNAYNQLRVTNDPNTYAAAMQDVAGNQLDRADQQMTQMVGNSPDAAVLKSAGYPEMMGDLMKPSRASLDPSTAQWLSSKPTAPNGSDQATSNAHIASGTTKMGPDGAPVDATPDVMNGQQVKKLLMPDGTVAIYVLGTDGKYHL